MLSETMSLDRERGEREGRKEKEKNEGENKTKRPNLVNSMYCYTMLTQ